MVDAPLLFAAGAPGAVDLICWFLVGTSVLVLTVAAVLIVGFAVHFRVRRDRTPLPAASPAALPWVFAAIPFALALFLFVWSVRVSAAGAIPPPGVLDITITAKQWMWQAQHPEGQRELNELHIPVQVPIRLTLTSQDVVHGFYVPAFRLQEAVLPGRETTAWFQANRTGEFHLFCAEFCGTGHSAMTGTVHVVEAPAYEQWLAGGIRGQTPVEAGQTLFRAFRCDTCHNKDEKATAPDLAGLFDSAVKLADGTSVTFDEAYVRESILDPTAKAVAGYQVVMQSYQGQLNEEQLSQIIQYLKSLK